MSRAETESKPVSCRPCCSELGGGHGFYLLEMAPSHQRGLRLEACTAVDYCARHFLITRRARCPRFSSTRSNSKDFVRLYRFPAAFVCVLSSLYLPNNLGRSSGTYLLASHYMKGKLRPGKLRPCPRSQNAGDIVLASTGHSRKDRSIWPHAIAPTHPVHTPASSFARHMTRGSRDLSHWASMGRAWGG